MDISEVYKIIDEHILELGGSNYKSSAVNELLVLRKRLEQKEAEYLKKMAEELARQEAGVYS